MLALKPETSVSALVVTISPTVRLSTESKVIFSVVVSALANSEVLLVTTEVDSTIIVLGLLPTVSTFVLASNWNPVSFLDPTNIPSKYKLV